MVCCFHHYCIVVLDTVAYPMRSLGVPQGPIWSMPPTWKFCISSFSPLAPRMTLDIIEGEWTDISFSWYQHGVITMWVKWTVDSSLGIDPWLALEILQFLALLVSSTLYTEMFPLHPSSFIIPNKQLSHCQIHKWLGTVLFPVLLPWVSIEVLWVTEFPTCIWNAVINWLSYQGRVRKVVSLFNCLWSHRKDKWGRGTLAVISRRIYIPP